jgi:hypothetical protein
MNPVTDISGLAALWQKVSGGDPGIRIAIIDGPVDLNHPALSQARAVCCPGVPYHQVRAWDAHHERDHGRAG